MRDTKLAKELFILNTKVFVLAFPVGTFGLEGIERMAQSNQQLVV